MIGDWCVFHINFYQALKTGKMNAKQSKFYLSINLRVQSLIISKSKYRNESPLILLFEQFVTARNAVVDSLMNFVEFAEVE